jgi:hypothetical protein
MSARWNLSWDLIEKAPCPHCGAKAGKRCRSPRGVPGAPHGERRLLAAEQGHYVPGGPERST